MQENPRSVGGTQNTFNADLVVDGEFSIKQQTVQNLVPNQKGHIVLPMFPDFQIGNPSMDPGSFHSPSQGSLSMESKRREQMLTDLWSRNSGVSQNQFLSVVRELKKTKNAFKEAQQKLAQYKNANIVSGVQLCIFSNLQMCYFVECCIYNLKISSLISFLEDHHTF
jgi:hypothetical protein